MMTMICKPFGSHKLTPFQVLETAPLTIVYSAKIRQHYDEALYLANALYFQGRYAPVIIPDTEFRADNPPSRNLIVLGSPNSNAAANYIHSLSPKGQLVHFDQQPDTNRFSFSLYRHDEKRDEDVPIVFSSLNHGILYLAPWTTNSTSGGNGIALIVAGNSLKAFRSTVRRLMPLTSNVMMGDFAVVDASRLAWQGMGGIVGYGFWSNEWRFDERTGFIDTSLVV